jgi:hypothetical protein
MNNEPEIRNARILGTSLGPYGDADAFVFKIIVGFATGASQCATQMVRHPAWYGAIIETIDSLLNTLDTQSWEELEGVYVRVKIEDGKIVSVGHILYDRWTSLKTRFPQ